MYVWAGVRRSSGVGVGGGGLLRQSRAGLQKAVERAVEQMWAELRTSFTLRHSLMVASVTAWSRRGGGRENRNNIKIAAVLAHSPAGHHNNNRQRREKIIHAYNTKVKTQCTHTQTQTQNWKIRLFNHWLKLEKVDAGLNPLLGNIFGSARTSKSHYVFTG